MFNPFPTTCAAGRNVILLLQNSYLADFAAGVFPGFATYNDINESNRDKLKQNLKGVVLEGDLSPSKKLQRRRHHGLDRVHAVFGLVEHDGAGALKHLVGDLHGIQTVLVVDLFANSGVQVVEGG